MAKQPGIYFLNGRFGSINGCFGFKFGIYERDFRNEFLIIVKLEPAIKRGPVRIAWAFILFDG